MAIVVRKKVIYVDLKKSVDYALDHKKTSWLDLEKNEVILLESAINGDGPDSIFEEMIETKRKFRSFDNRLGYNYVQSFHPDDPVTPQQVHDMGMRLAEEFFGERFQVAVSTHLNEDHLHNHFIINSVSFVDGYKYRDKKHYLKQLRAISDKICLEYGLTILNSKGKNRIDSHADRKDRKKGISPRDDLIRSDIDACINQSLSFDEFIARLKSLGYSVPRLGPNIKRMSVLPPGGEQARRIDQLGSEYTEEAIRRRIDANTPEQVREAIRKAHEKNHGTQPQLKTIRTYRGGKQYSRKKLKGLQARYYRILYTLGMIRKRPKASAATRAMYVSMYDQLRHLDSYVRQMRLITSHNIQSLDDLFAYRSVIHEKIDTLTKERNKLYKNNGVYLRKPQIDQLSAQLKDLKRALRDCESIEVRSVETEKRIQENQNSWNRHEKRQKEQQYGRNL